MALRDVGSAGGANGFTRRSQTESRSLLIVRLARSMESEWRHLRDAVVAGDLERVRVLVQGGADVNAVGSDGSTLPTLAALRGRLELVKYLVDQGADPIGSDGTARTPLRCAVDNGELEVVKYFEDRSAKVENNKWKTPLVRAAWSGDLDGVKDLLDRGADVNAADADGESALMKAAWRGELEVVRYLMEYSADFESVGFFGVTSLMKAAFKGELEVVKYLVSCGADVNVRSSDGLTALRYAAGNGKLDVVAFLIDRGAMVDAVDKKGRTPLAYAAFKGDLEMVKSLLDRGADINTANWEGQQALTYAAFEGKFDLVKYLVERGANIAAGDNYGKTPLTYAVFNGSLEIIKYLLSQGADINTVSNDENTLLVFASSNNQLEVMKYLVGLGADINAKDSAERTPLSYTASGGKLEALEYLVELGADVNVVDENGKTALLFTAEYGKWEAVKYLIDQGADVNKADESGMVPLMVAAADGELESMKHLVDKGADMNAVDEDGRTPLGYAVSHGKLEVIEYLLDRGADLDATENDGLTLLMLAADRKELETVKYLLGQGVDVEAVDNYGKTALMHAASKNELEVVRCLVNQGADVNIVDRYGKTPLMEAAESCSLQVTKYLVDRGADVNAIASDGLTSLMLASRNDQLEIVEYLVTKGADVNCKTTNEETAIHLAVTNGHIRIRDFLLQYVMRAPDTKVRRDTVATVISAMSLDSFLASKSWSISPFDIALIQYDNTKTIGGEYHAKWLDADVVLKLFTPEASASTFVDEVTTWHQLRHPNVIKLYGACDVGHSFFVLEFASNGSVVEFLAECEKRGERRRPWKFMYEAALGLAYLHERGIVHGNLRSSNILVGSDGVAKLADFGLAAAPSQTIDNPASSGFGSVRWQAPEQLEGEGASFASDIYSLGLCIVEAVTGQVPWQHQNESSGLGSRKGFWRPESSELYSPNYLDEDTNTLISRMCAHNPDLRSSATTVVRLLKQFATKESRELETTQPRTENIGVNVNEYNTGVLIQLLAKIRDAVALQNPHNPLHHLVLEEIEAIHKRLEQGDQSLGILEAYHSFLCDLDSILQSRSLHNRLLALSSTRATSNNFATLKRRINELWVMLDGSQASYQKREQQWSSLRNKQLELFVSDASQTVAVLNQLDDEATRSEFLTVLKTEIDNYASYYTESQLAVMKKAYEDCCQGEWDKSVTITPVWFLPWHELAIDKMKRIGEGGFGDVYLAKWLDSEVVVKEVKALGSDNDSNNDSMASTWLQIVSLSAVSMRTGNTIQSPILLRTMFEQEVNVWFGLSHPHVVRLFGACHVGTPFFACEYAGGGSLDKYLRRHPDEIWTKLHEAALGVQYLQSRNIIHGDLKCNNIVLGNDGKAKVTDFGLSSFEEDGKEAKLSGAWQWVAPECILHGASERSFASDVYSLGMCVVEALRVVEQVKQIEMDCEAPLPLPWGNMDNLIVKHYVTQKKLPKRPGLCTDEQWKLIERMCAHEPADRIPIMTVVNELDILARGYTGSEVEVVDCPDSLLSSRLVEVSAEMEALCRQIHDNANSQDHRALCQIYELLWTRLAQLVQPSEKGEVTAAQTKALQALFDRARGSTMLLERLKNTLFALTEVALQGYALHRDLDKLFAANRWHENEDAKQWRDRCWDLLTVG